VKGKGLSKIVVMRNFERFLIETKSIYSVKGHTIKGTFKSSLLSNGSMVSEKNNI
jgi:hypothetical protein